MMGVLQYCSSPGALVSHLEVGCLTMSNVQRHVACCPCDNGPHAISPVVLQEINF